MRPIATMRCSSYLRPGRGEYCGGPLRPLRAFTGLPVIDMGEMLYQQRPFGEERIPSPDGGYVIVAEGYAMSAPFIEECLSVMDDERLYTIDLVKGFPSFKRVTSVETCQIPQELDIVRCSAEELDQYAEMLDAKQTERWLKARRQNRRRAESGHREVVR